MSNTQSIKTTLTAEDYPDVGLTHCYDGVGDRMSELSDIVLMLGIMFESPTVLHLLDHTDGRPSSGLSSLIKSIHREIDDINKHHCEDYELSPDVKKFRADSIAEKLRA